MTTTIGPTAIRPTDAAAGGALPHKTFDVEFKEGDADDGSFTMYAAVFGNVDRGGDVIEQGAFDNLDEFVREGYIALNHDSRSLPLGYPTAAVQDDRGLRVAGKFHSTPAAQEARTVIRERRAAGKAVKCSIGYLTRKESFENRNGRVVRHIESLSVYETSVVNVAMNNSAEVTDAKGALSMPETPKPPAPEIKAGRAMSAANRDKLAEHVGAMEGHRDEMKKCIKSMSATIEEHKEFLKGFEPEDPEEAEEDEEEAKPGPKKAAPPPAEKSIDPPPDRHRIAAILASMHLSD